MDRQTSRMFIRCRQILLAECSSDADMCSPTDAIASNNCQLGEQMFETNIHMNIKPELESIRNREKPLQKIKDGLMKNIREIIMYK